MSALYKWSCQSPLRYVLIVGAGFYGTLFGLVLIAAFFWLGHLHSTFRMEMSFVFSWITGLLFGLCLWLFVKPLKENSHEGTPPRR